MRRISCVRKARAYHTGVRLFLQACNINMWLNPMREGLLLISIAWILLALQETYRKCSSNIGCVWILYLDAIFFCSFVGCLLDAYGCDELSSQLEGTLQKRYRKNVCPSLILQKSKIAIDSVESLFRIMMAIFLGWSKNIGILCSCTGTGSFEIQNLNLRMQTKLAKLITPSRAVWPLFQFIAWNGVFVVGSWVETEEYFCLGQCPSLSG